MAKYLTTHKQALGIKSLSADLYSSPFEHTFDAQKRYPPFTLLYIVRGEVNFHTTGYSVHGAAGDFFYIPHGIRYHSVWQGKGGTAHYCIHMYLTDDSPLRQGSYRLQRVAKLSCEDTRSRMVAVYHMLQQNTPAATLSGLCAVLSLYTDTLPLLVEAPEISYSPLLTNTVNYIQKHYAEAPDIPEIARAMQVSESTLYHLFKRELGITPIRYYNRFRLEQVVLALGEPAPIEEIAYRHGFASYGYFRELFKAYTGMTPQAYRRQKYGK